MKIAFVSQPIDSVLPPYQNSVGACTYGSARALAKDHEVAVYGMKDGPQDASTLVDGNLAFHLIEPAASDHLLSKIRSRVARAVTLQPVSTSPFNYPAYARTLARELSRRPFDVIHIQHLAQYAPLIRQWNPKAKIVVHLHAEWFSQSEGAALVRRLEKLDLLTAVSDYVSKQVGALLPTLRKPCVTHYNGFEPLEFAREKDYAALARRPERRILFAGGISPHKGIHVLIDAFKILAAEFPDVRLNLSGPAGTYPLEETFDRNDRARLAELAPFYQRELSLAQTFLGSARKVVPDYISQLKERLPAELADRVTFLGKIPRGRLIDHYYESDVFVFPSLFDEGFGLPPVEAMAAGTPVVATRAGAIVETVVPGVTGLLVEKNDAKALAAAIRQLLESAPLREKMGRAGRSRAFGHFTWDGVTAKMAASYEKLCSS